MISELESVYKNKPIILWVEDLLTRTWLHQVWEDDDIGLLVAGGNDAVFGAVKDAREAGHTNVFGFRDRDFISSNQSDWLAQAKNPTVFVPDAHEVENFLLDFPGLAALGASYNPRKRSAGDLEIQAQRRAASGLWWMAARATIADVRTEVTGDFPSHPKLGNPVLSSLTDAQLDLEQRLLQSGWSTRIRAAIPSLDANWIAGRLTHHEALLRVQLNDGSWRWSWSGKELFAHVAGYLGYAVFDLAKGLAEQQRANGTVDPVMTDLRAALRKRTGLEVW
jgi:hypothetical protein